MWTLTEQDAVLKMVSSHNLLRSALEKFANTHADALRRDCAQAMQSVPRSYERAADYAAKAEVYANLLKELERDCTRQTSG
jgi:hypothetical protein